MSVTLLPDVERLVSNYLRANTDVTALVGQNVYTVMPKNPVAKFPLVRLTRITGAPLFSQPLRYDEAHLQVDCYGGSKQTAWQTAATIASVLAEGGLIGTQAEGVVVNVEVAGLQDLPDDSFDPPQPRWILDVNITARS